MLNNTDQIKLFACCIPVQGAKRSLICDIQRGGIHLIPTSFYEMIVKNPVMVYQDLIQDAPSEDHETIYEYLSFLLEKQLAHVTDSPELFPAMKLDWKSPLQVTNCIFDLDENYNIWHEAIEQITDLGCKHIQMRIFSKISCPTLHELLVKLDDSPVRSVEIILNYSEWMTVSALNELYKRYSRIFSVVVFNASAEEDKNTHQEMGKITFIAENIDSSLHCGKIHPTLFNINVSTFAESQGHNSCLNRKISVDVNGNIKNCPSMSRSFGNVRETTLQSALDHPEFKKNWNVTKDQIDVCKDCEFRYICTDCRAYLENPEDQYSKPLKCGYNPYTCKWEDWSSNPLKQQAIDFYGMREVLPEFQLQPDYVPL